MYLPARDNFWREWVSEGSDSESEEEELPPFLKAVSGEGVREEEEVVVCPCDVDWGGAAL